ncbi:hypothetical protein FWK35_00020718 [Aphis craccivora]|uniref:Uncharacterized protein n=1 Tax=Aphis craccivora TaxID=307492 RepID=A0A6G0XRU7_APHCR|nr:hypothetical protein FWK35_00020718 [Aphis craccivora]
MMCVLFLFFFCVSVTTF